MNAKKILKLPGLFCFNPYYYTLRSKYTTGIKYTRNGYYTGYYTTNNHLMQLYKIGTKNERILQYWLSYQMIG